MHRCTKFPRGPPSSYEAGEFKKTYQAPPDGQVVSSRVYFCVSMVTKEVAPALTFTF